MKKIILTSSTMFFVALFSFGQTDTFVPGYYIINSTAQYSVAMPSGMDFSADENGCMHQFDPLQMNSGEVVIAFELAKGKYYCFDPNGRMVVFQGQNCLTKAPMVAGASVGNMSETISLIDGSSIGGGAYYWIMGQNIANSTVTIQVADGKTYEIPQAKITLYGAYIKNTMKNQTYVNVED